MQFDKIWFVQVTHDKWVTQRLIILGALGVKGGSEWRFMTCIIFYEGLEILYEDVFGNISVSSLSCIMAVFQRPCSLPGCIVMGKTLKSSEV